MGKVDLGVLDKREYSLEKKREYKIKKLGQQIASKICVDKPLPSPMLARYCATVCLSGMEQSFGRERIDWTNTLCRIMKLEHDLKHSEDPTRADAEFQSLNEMFEASNLMVELEAEVKEHEKGVGEEEEEDHG